MPLPENTQHSQETDMHTAGGIRTRDPSKLAAAHPARLLRQAKLKSYLELIYRNVKP